MQSEYVARAVARTLSLIAGVLVAAGCAWSSSGADEHAAAAGGTSTLSSALAAALEQCPGDGDAIGGPPGKPGFTPPIFLRPPNPADYYSPAAGEAAAHGSLKVEVLVDRYGNPRFAHIVRLLLNSAQGALAEATLRLARESRFKAATQAGEPVAVWKVYKVSYRFVPGGYLGGVYSHDEVKLMETKARAGNHQAIVDLVHLYEMAPSDTTVTSIEYSQLLADAALAGSGEAKLTVSQRLGKPSCHKTPEILDYLHKVAWGGFSAAELLMATRMLEASSPAQYHNASILLHGAANSSDSFVQTWATGLLATSPQAEIRDPEFALQAA